MSIGDVLSVIAGVLAVGGTLAATLTAIVILFRKRASAARAALETRPARTFGTGAACVLFVSIFGIALVGQPNGLLKLIAWVVLAAFFALAALGAAGIALLCANRIETFDTRVRPLTALWRGSLLIVAAGFLPIVGWFMVFPVSVIFSLGAAMTTFLEQRPRTAAAVSITPLGLSTPENPG